MSSDELPLSASHFFVFSTTFSHLTNNFSPNKTPNFSSLFNTTFPLFFSVICVFLISFPIVSLAAPFHATGAHQAGLTKDSNSFSIIDRSVTARPNNQFVPEYDGIGNFRWSGSVGDGSHDASLNNRPDKPEHLKSGGSGPFESATAREKGNEDDNEVISGDNDKNADDDASGDGDRDVKFEPINEDEEDEAARVFSRLLSTPSPMEENWENDSDEAERMRRAVTQALCPIKQGKRGEDEIAQLTKSTCTQTIAQSMCEEDGKMEVRRGEIRPLGESRSAAVYYGHELCFSFFSRGATKTDGCMSMCMVKDREYEVSLDVSGYTRTYWTLKFTGDCYFCGFSQPLTVVLCVFLSIVVIAATCCVCCRTDPSRQLSTMHEAMQKQMQKIVNSRNAASDEAKNPPEDIGEADPGGETQGDITMDNDNLDATRDNDNMDVTRDDDNLDATRDTRSRASPTGTRPSPSMQSRSEAVTPSAPVADDSRLFDESKDWTDREC